MRERIKYFVNPEEGVVVGVCRCDLYDFVPPSLNEVEDRVFQIIMYSSKRLRYYRKDCFKDSFELRATARCSKDDIFDEKFGKKLVEAKIERKKHKLAMKIQDVVAKEMRDMKIKMASDYAEHEKKNRSIEVDLISYFGLEGV